MTTMMTTTTMRPLPPSRRRGVPRRRRQRAERRPAAGQEACGDLDRAPCRPLPQRVVVVGDLAPSCLREENAPRRSRARASGGEFLETRTRGRVGMKGGSARRASLRVRAVLVRPGETRLTLPMAERQLPPRGPRPERDQQSFGYAESERVTDQPTDWKTLGPSFFSLMLSLFSYIALYPLLPISPSNALFLAAKPNPAVIQVWS